MSLNSDFLKTLEQSFKKYLETSPRSNEKLKILHSRIASDISSLLGTGFTVDSLNFGSSHEKTIQGRYLDKKVDICISKNNVPVAGIAVKFVMSNYSQNSNNYFESMLGETANIRTANILYFQVFVIPRHLPYFDNGGIIRKVEKISRHNIEKYVKLSNDDINTFFHTPNKTLFVLLETNTVPETGQNMTEYKEHCEKATFTYSSRFENLWSNQVIYNDYRTFTDKVRHAVLAI